MASALDQTLQDLSPLGLHTPLGQDTQPLQPPAPLGHQVQLQPLPPLGTSRESFTLDDAIANLPSESNTQPDHSSESTDTAPDSTALEKIPTDTHSTPSVQRKSVHSATPSEANDSLNESEAIAPSTSPAPKPETPDYQASESITNESITNDTPNRNTDYENITNQNIASENIANENLTHENPTNDNITLSLKPDENSTVARKSELFAEGRSHNQGDAGSHDENNYSEPTVDLPDIEKQLPSPLNTTKPEAEAVQPEPASQHSIPSPAQPDAIASPKNSPIQLQANNSLSENTPQSSVADQPDAIASPDLTAIDQAETEALTSPEQPTVQRPPVQRLVPSEHEPSDEAGLDEAGLDEAIAPDSPTIADVPSAESGETTPSQIQRRLEAQHQDEQDEQDKTAIQSLEPLGQSKPLIQKADIFLSRFQTEQDQENHLTQPFPEPAEVTATPHPEATTSNPNDPIHFLTVPGRTVPDHWSTLAELLGHDASPSTPSAQERDAQPELTYSPESSHSVMGEEPLPQLESEMRSPAATPELALPSNSAEPAEAAIPTAWSSLTELLNESLDSPKLNSATQNTQETQVSATAQPQPQQPTKPKDIEINEATMEVLTRQIYQAIRSRLVLEQERLWGHSTSPFPWFEVPSSPALKSLERANIPEAASNSLHHQHTSRTSTIHSLDTLSQTIYQLLQQRLEIERERQGYAIASYSRHAWR